MRGVWSRALLALVVLAVLPAGAQAKQDAAGVDAGMGCPQGYVAFDAQRGQGGPPSYLPGATVTASGYLTDAKANGSTSVKVRWGSPEGAVLGEAALDSEGNYKGLTFAIPEATPRRIHTLYLEARDPEGNLLPGLPIPARLRVGPPPAPPTAAPKKRAVTPVEVEKRSRARSAPTPQRAPQPQPLPLPQSRAPGTIEAVAEAREAVRNGEPTNSRSEPRPARRQVERVNDDGIVAPRTLDAAARSEVAPAADRPPASNSLVAALAGLFGLVFLAAILLRRRAARVLVHPPLDPPSCAVSAPAPKPSPTDDPIEAELQEMISEERARHALEPAGEPVEVGRTAE